LHRLSHHSSIVQGVSGQGRAGQGVDEHLEKVQRAGAKLLSAPDDAFPEQHPTEDLEGQRRTLLQLVSCERCSLAH
jgi:hypothetical protein